MADFNEAIKTTKSGRISVASYCDIVICKTMKEFQKAVCGDSRHDILIREYGGAISSKMLYQLLDRCDYEYDKALQTIIDTGLLECSIRDDGDIACFYIPNNDLQQKLPL